MSFYRSELIDFYDDFYDDFSDLEKRLVFIEVYHLNPEKYGSDDDQLLISYYDDLDILIEKIFNNEFLEHLENINRLIYFFKELLMRLRDVHDPEIISEYNELLFKGFDNIREIIKSNLDDNLECDGLSEERFDHSVLTQVEDILEEMVY